MPFAAALFAAALSLTSGAAPAPDALQPGLLPLAVEGWSQVSTAPIDPGLSAGERLRAGAHGRALLTAGLHEAAAVRGDAPAPAVQEIRSRGAVPLMAAGGALFIAGLLIGDDLGTLLAVGGAVVGSYGVYLYF